MAQPATYQSYSRALATPLETDRSRAYGPLVEVAGYSVSEDSSAGGGVLSRTKRRTSKKLT